MAEDKSASEPVAGLADPVAIGVALNHPSPAVAEELAAYLHDQRHHLHEQLQQIHLDIWEKRLGVALRLATLFVGLTALAAVALVAWQASRAAGTVVDAFSVPPALAQAGITGEVVATDLTQKIAAIGDIGQNNSLNTSQDVRQDAQDEIKVDIPETGISLGQAWRYLRLWLGHEHHLSGNLRQGADGRIALTVAVNGRQAIAFEGAAADLGKLEQQVAERVFADVDPINIVLYLRTTGRGDEALATAGRGTLLPNPPDKRADMYGLWASMTRNQLGNLPLSLARARIGIEIDPQIASARREAMWAQYLMGHDELALQQTQLLSRTREADQSATFQGRGYAEVMAQSGYVRNAVQGAFAQIALDSDCTVCPLVQQDLTRAEFTARAHDGAGSRALLAQMAAVAPAGSDLRAPRGSFLARSRYFLDAMLDNWPAALADARAYEAQVRADHAIIPGAVAERLRTQVPPLLALALAGNGDASGAEAAIAPTPGDCYDCVRTRGLVAAATKQWGRADYWFARAASLGPSLPLAHADWGRSYLDRRQANAAIAQFALANSLGPHFADPLEYWGEALMAKNQSHLALAKFAEAEKYAPNWGRLHLKWGEALIYAGKPGDARAHFARAATLDLTPSEKFELQKFSTNRI